MLSNSRFIAVLDIEDRADFTCALSALIMSQAVIFGLATKSQNLTRLDRQAEFATEQKMAERSERIIQRTSDRAGESMSVSRGPEKERIVSAGGRHRRSRLRRPGREDPGTTHFRQPVTLANARAGSGSEAGLRAG